MSETPLILETALLALLCGLALLTAAVRPFRRKEPMNRYCPLCAARLGERRETDNMTGRESVRLACPNGCWKGRGHERASQAVGEFDDAYRRLNPDHRPKERQ